MSESAYLARMRQRLDEVLHHDMGVLAASSGPLIQDEDGRTLIAMNFEGELLCALSYDDPDNEADFESLLMLSADSLQTHVMDLIHAAAPKCPLHDHPVLADQINGMARWRCPLTDLSWQMGALGEE